MADPLSVLPSLMAAATGGIQSARSLKEAAGRYKTRDATLRKLVDGTKDAENILVALEELLGAANSNPGVEIDNSMAALLRGPIERCSKECQQFEVAMAEFSKKSKTNFLDWSKMEFKRGDINQFLDTVAEYKATISVGLGVFTMRTVKLSHKALEEYDSMVQDTMQDLNIRLQRIDEKMNNLVSTSDASIPLSDIDLDNEREVTEQCLRICEDAKQYLESLATRDTALLQHENTTTSANALQKKFEAQLLTRQALEDNQAEFVKIITRLRQRLESVVLDDNSTDRIRLQEDIQSSKQCLEVCKLASSEVSSQKVHIIGEVVADSDSDHMVVTTLADMFNVGKSISKNRSALLVGSMSDEALIKVSHDRYNSRFGSSTAENHVSQGRTTNIKPEVFDHSSSSLQTDRSRMPAQQRSSATSNETRKRVADPGAQPKKD